MSDVFSVESLVIISSNTAIQAHEWRNYLKEKWSTFCRQDARILILAGIHGNHDGKLGAEDEGLYDDNLGQVRLLKDKSKRKFKDMARDMEEKNIKLDVVDVGKHNIVTSETKGINEGIIIDSERLISSIRERNPTIVILAFCWSRLSELNDVLRAAGIYPEMILNEDLVTITKGRSLSLDPTQRRIIHQVSQENPKNVFFYGQPGTGKTVLAAQVINMKVSHYTRQLCKKYTMEECKTKIKVIVCTYTSTCVPLTDDLQDNHFGLLQSRANCSFYGLGDFCQDFDIEWEPSYPISMINNIIKCLVEISTSFENILLMIDEVDPGNDWSTLIQDTNKLDLVISIRPEQPSDDPNSIQDSFFIEPPKNDRSRCFDLQKRYRCGAEIVIFLLFYTKHTNDHGLLSGNNDTEPLMEKLPEAAHPMWITKSNDVSEISVLETIQNKISSDVSVVVTVEDGNINLDTARWCEGKGWMYLPAYDMIGYEASVVIALDFESFDLECFGRARNQLFLITTLG